MKMIKNLKKLPALATTTLMTIMINSTSFASGIGTAEVQTATENIKRVITSIAMPLRWCSYLCKYCYCSN